VSGVTSMLNSARASIGTSGRPNDITREYSTNHGSLYLREPWCDMSVTYWARHSGNAAAVLPAGDRAYTVWHAQDFQRAGRWHVGTESEINSAKPGDIVFFDWGATNNVGAIDHVGIVETALGDGRVQTIEGNTGDAVARRVRSYSVIAGYGRPAYSGGASSSGWTENMVGKLPTIAKGAKGTNEAVQTARGLLLARSHPEIGTVMDRDFDTTMDKAVRSVQAWGKVAVDGVIGPDTWGVLLRVH